MERYTVSIRHPETGDSLPLLIPFFPASTISTFADEIKKRAAKYGSFFNGRDFSLRLGQEDGPILDFDDTLSDIVLDSRSEHIFVIFQDLALLSSAKRIRLAPGSDITGLRGFKIRVITPLLAKSFKEISSIPLLGNGTIISGRMTLREIKSRIIEFLGLSISDLVHSQGNNECNCAFARQIHQRGLWEKMDCEGCTSSTSCRYRSESNSLPVSTPCAICHNPFSDHKGGEIRVEYESECASPCGAKVFVRTDTSCKHWFHSQCLESGGTWSCPQSCLSLPPSNHEMLSKFILVHGRNNVEWVDTDHPDGGSILQNLRGKFGNDIEEKKAIVFIGEMQHPSRSAYLKLPVISLCSLRRHMDDTKPAVPAPSAESSSTGEDRILDLHTSEAPIETANLDLTVDQVGLDECTVNGVLNIYVVERIVSKGDPQKRGTGQDAIFGMADFWKHPITQSDRAMAAFLSSLRLFTDCISTKKMNQSSQNAILRLVLLFTRFPPALRAIHTLMNAKSLRPSESTALVQAFYQVVKEIVPIELIQSDEGRVLEGSRLLFGFLLDRAAQLEDPDQNSFPYLWSLKTVDLKNFETLEAVEVPVLTSFGLVEEGYYNAYRSGGILSWCNGEEPLEAAVLDQRTKRIALLCGGMFPEITIFDSDSLSSLTQSNETADEELIGAQAFASLSHLATLCERHNFAVVPPVSLSSSTAPTLTIDRDGLLAVYTGRTPCSAPGQDIAIFRPTKGGEETVDVAIITQIIAPILQQRTEDGTWVFDSFGGVQKRNEGVPDELIMFCVDCSRSMHGSSDFEEIKAEEESEETDVEDNEEESGLENTDIEDGTYPNASLDEMKDRILKHESFEDILAILKHANHFSRATTATTVLEYLNNLFSRELSYYLKRLESMRGWATSTHLRNRRNGFDAKITALKSSIAGLITHKKALCDFILFRAGDFTGRKGAWVWKAGDEIPKWPKKSGQNSAISDQLVIPHEYICPIGREVFEDPVTASDGFTYERASIQRWFQLRFSSPSTGLDLTDTNTLVRNVPLTNTIKKWIEGEELLQPSPRASTRRSYFRDNYRSIQFFSPLGSFTRRIPPSISTATLYRLAFRGMKGRYSHFDLHCNGTIIESSERSGLQPSVWNCSVISINVHEEFITAPTPSTSQQTAPQAEFEEICLIKVFTSSTENVLFSYWTSKNTTNTLASVLFRYWRYLAEMGWMYRSHDMDVWSGLKYIGDGSLSGSNEHHWESLSQFLTQYKAVGKLEPEAAYGDKSDDAILEPETTEAPPTHPLVLRLYLTKRSVSKKKKSKKPENLSRMDVSKQIFEAFINRTLAYNYSTHIGLITFDTTAKVSQEITNVLEDFRGSVTKMEARGDTALWDSLALANDQLSEYGQQFPNAKKRIICLSDGEDNKSSKREHEIWWNLVQNQVVVDSFCIGDENNVNLRTISYLSGGYKFHPKTLEQAMSICEMEPVLNQLERPSIRRAAVPFLSTGRSGIFWSSMTNATPDPVTRDSFPKRKEHPNLEDQFISLSSIARAQRRSTVAPSSTAAPRSNSHIRSARLLSEMRNILANPHPQYDVYVSESNIGFWKIVMQGPPQSSYSTGTFLLYLDMEENYPMFPPKGRFCTSIIHPNINRHGRICHSILDRNWTLDTTNLQVLNTIYSLLLVPEFSDPINTVVTLNFHWDEVAFQEEVRAHIARHATKSRDTWRTELLYSNTSGW